MSNVRLEDPGAGAPRATLGRIVRYRNNAGTEFAAIIVRTLDEGPTGPPLTEGEADLVAFSNSGAVHIGAVRLGEGPLTWGWPTIIATGTAPTGLPATTP